MRLSLSYKVKEFGGIALYGRYALFNPIKAAIPSL